MYFVFFALWIVFNGRFSVEIALIGLAVSAALYVFCWKFLNFSPRRERRILLQTFRFIQYLGTLLAEIVKANLQLTRIVLSRKPEIHPQLITFRTPLKSRSGRTLLADSITLTPGTITVLLENDELTVHCLDEAFAEGVDDLVFQRRLLVMEGGAKAHDA